MGRILAAVATAAITLVTSPAAMQKIADLLDPPNKGKGKGKR